MDEVILLNPKGGCGKTTVATQLAGYYANAGKYVALIDHDTQKSATDWLSGRSIERKCIHSFSAKTEVNSDVEVLISDLPAGCLHPAQYLGQLHARQHILIPVLSSPTDIKACLRFIMAITREGWLEQGPKIGLLANRTRRNTRYFSVLMAFLERVNIPIVGQLRDTQNYVRVMEQGLSLFDLPRSRVDYDLAQWQSIIAWLGTQK